MAEASAASGPAYTVTSYDCDSNKADIERLTAIVEKQQEGLRAASDPPDFKYLTRFQKMKFIRPFDYRVMPWTSGCEKPEGVLSVRHYVAQMKEGDKEIVGWLVAHKRTDKGMPRDTARIYLSEISTIRVRKAAYRGVGDALLKQLREDAEDVTPPWGEGVTFIYLYPLRPELEPVYKARGYLNYRELSERLHTAPNRQYDVVRHMFLVTKGSKGKSMNDIIPDDLMNAMKANVNQPRISAMYDAEKMAKDAAANGVEGADTLVDLFTTHRRHIQKRWEELQNELDNFDMFADDPHPMSEEEKIQALLAVAVKAVKEKQDGGRRKTARNTHRLRFLRKHRMTVRGYSLGELSKVSKVSQPILQQVYDRGIGAYKTNPTSVRMKGTFRKGVRAPYSKKLSKEQWAMARVYSFLDGNPKHDTDLRRKTRRRHK